MPGPDRRDHPCPSPGCELHRVMTDRSGAASHQKRLALYRPSDKYGAMRGHPRHAQGRSFREGHVVGEFGHQIMGECDVFRRGSLPAAVALTVVEPDALAKPTLGHARTDLVDHPRAVTVRHDAGILHRRRTPSPIRVRRVDAGGFEPHAHLPVTGLGGRQLAADQNLVSRSLPVVPNRAHRRLRICDHGGVLSFFGELSPRQPVPRNGR
jgi:hypothetical protein